MKPAQPRSWPSDRAAWAIYATGIAAMFAVFYVSLVWGDYGVISEHWERSRARLIMFLAAAGFALSGPFAATVGQAFAHLAMRSSGKEPKPVGFEDF
jgi:hypothetical protein